MKPIIQFKNNRTLDTITFWFYIIVSVAIVLTLILNEKGLIR